jgi:hypothetical protein
MARGKECALLTLLVAELPNTMFVQLHGLRLGEAPAYSLYAFYREAEMEFEAATRLQRGKPEKDLAELLNGFVRSPSFRTGVLVPLVREVRTHFRRELQRP